VVTTDAPHVTPAYDRTQTLSTDHQVMRELPTIDEPVPILDLSREEIDELTEEVRSLAAERNAVILAHNYQVPEIQDLADFVGDSLGRRLAGPLTAGRGNRR
jgi:quinolinate synthase